MFQQHFINTGHTIPGTENYILKQRHPLMYDQDNIYNHMFGIGNMNFNKDFHVLNSTNNKLCTVNMSIVFHLSSQSQYCLEVKVNNADNNDENGEETIDLNTNKFYGIHFDYNDLIKIFKLNTA